MAQMSQMALEFFNVNNYFPVPWEEDSPEMVWHQTATHLRALACIESDSDAGKLLTEYQERSLISSIYFSNHIEGKGLGVSETTALVLQVIKGSCGIVGPQDTYVNDITMAQREVLQHAASFVFLHEHVVSMNQKLTTNLVLAAHKILMTNMVNEDGKSVNAGEYRTSSAHAGFHLFPPPTVVKSELEDLLESYNTRVNSSKEDPIAIAAWLSYKFVTIRPFDDGNGRMCRILMNIALLSCGMPFCSALGFSSGHKQAKKQYLQCIRNARRTGDVPTRLAFVILCSIRDTLSSYFGNTLFCATSSILP